MFKHLENQTEKHFVKTITNLTLSFFLPKFQAEAVLYQDKDRFTVSLKNYANSRKNILAPPPKLSVLFFSFLQSFLLPYLFFFSI